MREQVRKAMKYHLLIEVVYMDQSGNVTKRRIKVLKLNGDKMWVWDIAKQAKRTFLLDHVLACQPVFTREREVV